MDEFSVLAGQAAGLIVALLLFASIHFGWVTQYKRLLALVASVIAGIVIALLQDGADISLDTVLLIAGSAVAASQTVYGLVLSSPKLFPSSADPSAGSGGTPAGSGGTPVDPGGLSSG